MRKASFFTAILIALSPGFAWTDVGQSSFQQKCAACHTVGGGDTIGPDLSGVSQRRDPDWLIRWIMEPDKMLAEGDPIAVDLFKQFHQVPMPNFGVTEEEAHHLIEYINSQSESASALAPQLKGESKTSDKPPLFGNLKGVQKIALWIFLILASIVAYIFWQVVRTTKDPVATIDMKSAYRLRRKFFIGASVLILGVLAATLPRTPYPDKFQTPDHVIYATAQQFSFLFSAEPILAPGETGSSGLISSLEIAAGALIEFRVTSLDVNHAFGIYDEDRAIIAQTQAMPGYVNRLRVRFREPGTYQVLCLEYCGVAHHLMRTEMIVR